MERRLARLPATWADVHADLVAGYRIVAITSEGQMVYHTDSHGFAVTCGGNAASAPQVQPPSRSPPDR